MSRNLTGYRINLVAAWKVRPRMIPPLTPKEIMGHQAKFLDLDT